MTVDQYFDLQGKRALVTGASRGIGRGIALGLASAGAEVVVHYKNSKAAAEDVAGTIEASGGQASVIAADLTRDVKDGAWAVAATAGTKDGTQRLLLVRARLLERKGGGR